MKIGLIGNINNNNFALMRYFRDLGADAHLLLWSDDGTGTMSHFAPESDTWDIGAWKDYIHSLDFPQSYFSVVGWPSRLELPPSSRRIERGFREYKALVGSGLAPAILGRAGRRLDIFYPYSTGIEYVDELSFQEVLRGGRWGWRVLYKHLRRLQVSGIHRAKHCVNAEMGPTRAAFQALGRNFLPLAIPMVYNREVVDPVSVPPSLLRVRDEILRHDFKCFSHARHMWAWADKAKPDDWATQNKHNDWLIRGFSDYLKEDPGRNALLVILEYGPDAEHSRRLVHELDIERSVLWLPRMPRKDLMYLLAHCDLGVGEFTVEPGCIWGGTGWEVLASGKPLLQAFNFTEEGFEETFGHPPPPLLDVKGPEDVTRHLLEVSADSGKAARIGRESAEWFNTHNGIGLARKWLDLLESSSR